MAQGWLDKPLALAGKRIFVAGHRGLAGSAIMRRLQGEGCEIVTANRDELDLREQEHVRAWMQRQQPDIVILAAAKVGGILANAMQPADFLYDNIMIEANVIRAAHEAGVEKLLFLGSSCIYPKHALQPMQEEALLTGALEPTNEAYAIAKIAGLKLCEAYHTQHGCDFISAMPCNLYGPGDTFDEQNSHIIPALLMKAHAAKMSGAAELEIWGSGKPLREFLHADDLADGLVFLLKNYSGAGPVNIGSGEEINIQNLAEMIARVTGFEARLAFDASKPDGAPRKLLDCSKIKSAGWQPQIGLETGLRQVYEQFQRDNGQKKAA